jgi:hypothetical protein
VTIQLTARLLAAVTVFGIFPYAEELWRCWRAKPTIRPLPRPDAPATTTLRIPPERRRSLCTTTRRILRHRKPVNHLRQSKHEVPAPARHGCPAPGMFGVPLLRQSKSLTVDEPAAALAHAVIQ